MRGDRWSVATLALQAPGLVVVALALGLAVFEGGFAGAASYPATVLALALLVVAWISVGRMWSVPRLVAAGLGGYAAFCLWSYASILWAQAPGAALEGANRAALYLIALTLVAVVPWPASAARAALALVAIGVSAIAVATLVWLQARGAPLSAFIDGRLLTPLGYANATANFWCIAIWPALAFATAQASSRAARAVRPVALAAAGLLAQTALLSQSRGAVLAFGVTAVLFVALSPRRGQALLALLALAAAIALSWGALLDVRSATSAAGLSDALSAACGAIAVSSLALLLVGAAFEGLMALAPRGAARLGSSRAGNRAAIATAAVLAVAALAAIGNPATWVDAHWRDFRGSGYEKIDASGSRFTGSLGSGRYDYWRVALNEFRAHPLNGIGADNFRAAYLRERRTDEAPQHPHSLAMRLLSQGGIVGAAAFLAFLGAFLASAWLARRHADRLVSAALLSAFAMWFVHAQVDWLWAFPALGMLAFSMLAISARLTGDDPPAAPPAATGVFAREPRRDAPLWLTAPAVLAAVAVAAALMALAGASRANRQATDEAATDPRAAIGHLEQAARWDPLSAEPLVTEAVLARRIGDRARARRSLRRALEREPANWFTEFEVGLLDATSGLRAAALAHLARASELNPRQTVIGEASADVRRGARIDANSLESELDRQRTARLDPVGGG